MRANLFLAISAIAIVALAAASTPNGQRTDAVAAGPDSLPAVSAPAGGDTAHDAQGFEIEPEALPTLAYLRSRHTGLSQDEVVHLAQVIQREAARHGLAPELVLAVIRVESSGYNFAVSHVGALGLMQLMPPTGKELARRYGLPWHGPETLFNPEINIQLGTAYLRELADRYGKVETALAAYNWGPGRIDGKIRRGVGVPTRYTNEVAKAFADTTGLDVLPQRS